MGRPAIVPVLTDALATQAVVVAQTRQVIIVRAALKRDDGELVAEASAQQVLQALDGRLGQVLKAR